MTGFSAPPRVPHGAIAAVGLADPLSRLVVFQYNPDTIRRTVSAPSEGIDTARGAQRLSGPPDEALSFEVDIDAADQAAADGARDGVYPSLSRLELLLYPDAAVAIANDALAALGVIEMIPPEAPLTVLVWGARRAVPVRLSSFSITEEAFDASLNPVRARVALELTVLSYRDLGVRSAGGAMFL